MLCQHRKAWERDGGACYIDPKTKVWEKPGIKLPIFSFKCGYDDVDNDSGDDYDDNGGGGDVNGDGGSNSECVSGTYYVPGTLQALPVLTHLILIATPGRRQSFCLHLYR